MTTTWPPAPPAVGMLVTGHRFTSTRRCIALVTAVGDGYVIGLLAYASTFTPGGQYEGSYRGRVVLDIATVREVSL